MDQRENTYLHHQQQRFMRPDAARYLRPDTMRFLKPGSEKASIYPALTRKYEGQPRIPEGEEGGGQFTFGLRYDGTSYDGDRPRVYISSNPGDERSTRDADLGEGADDWGNSLDNFLAAATPPGIGHNQGPSLEEPPEIPDVKPARSPSTILRAAANWIAKALVARAFPAVTAFIGILNFRNWTREKTYEIITSLDPPRTMEELEAAVDIPRAGTELHHHKMEQHVSKHRGMTQSKIDAPGNRVRIPTLKHYEITKWYRQPDETFGGLSPRQYLADKPADEHARVGRQALVLYKVLKP